MPETSRPTEETLQPDERQELGQVTERASRRQPELDALRGILLFGMTLTHLPTHASLYAYQPFGFVAAAEGFIFVSALLTGRIYIRLLEDSGVRAVVSRLWERAVKLYAYHLLLLAVAFTVVAALAVRTQQPALQGLLDFYLAHRALAIWSSVLLVYCPPLLDILPMYIIFLLLTPLALFAGRRWGWRWVLAPSGLLWIAAQFGLRQFLYFHIVNWTGLAVPLQNLGAFNLFAWQFLWAAGLWLGAGIQDEAAKRWTSRPVVMVSLVVTVVFFVLRYQLLPYLAAHPIDQGNNWVLFDKWQLGVMRLLNFGALAILFAAARPRIARWLAVEPLVVLGQSSLEVFTVHLLFCFAALAWVGDGAGAPFRDQLGIIVITFTGLYALAYYRFQRKREAKQNGTVRAFPTAAHRGELREAA